jgi:hypothetical protein
LEHGNETSRRVDNDVLRMLPVDAKGRFKSGGVLSRGRSGSRGIDARLKQEDTIGAGAGAWWVYRIGL